MKVIFGLFILVFLLMSCRTSDDNLIIREKRRFISFEFSYTDGWTKSLSIRVDSNNIFFYPKTWDTVKYGLIPDTLSTLIDRSVAELLNKKSTKKQESICEDCPVIGIKLITNSDTVKIVETGDQIERAFSTMVNSLEQFIESNQLTLTNPNIAMVLETQRMILPPPPAVKVDSIVPPR